MFDKPTATHTLGLDLDDFSFKGAALSYARNKITVNALFDYLVVQNTREEGGVKPLYTEEEAGRLSALKDSCLVVSGAATEDILVRPLELRLKKIKTSMLR